MRIHGWLTLVLLSSACAIEGGELENEGPEDVDASVASLNGDLTTEGCSSAQRTKLLQAMSILRNEVGPTGDLAACLTDAMLLRTNNLTAEAIFRRISEDMPTRVRCVPDKWCGASALACADYNLPDERVNVEVDYLDGTSVESLASTLAHEVAHNKGFIHPDNSTRPYKYTVPLQVGHCIDSHPEEDGHPEGIERMSLPRETELSPIGGAGGSPFEMNCGACEFARGFRVDSSTTNINRMAMFCDASTTNSVGEYKDSTKTLSPQCPAGQVVVGLMSSSSSMVNALIAICQSESTVIAGVPTGGSVLALGGQYIGVDNVTRRCPPRMALKRVYGRAGARIDQMRLVCETFVGPKQGVPHNLPILGTATGSTERRQCLGNGAIVGLGGRSNAELDALFSTCTITTNDVNGGIVADVGDTQHAYWYTHLLDEVGGSGGVEFDDFCPGGQMLVGLAARAGQRIDQLRGICAVPNAWVSTGPTPPLTYTPKRGGETGIAATRTCPRGELITGMQTWTSTVPGRTPSLFGIMPICRRMNYPSPNPQVPPVCVP